MTMISREPRQIVGFAVHKDKHAYRLQNIVDNAPPAENYYTDGYHGYLDVIFPGRHIRNVHDKSETFLVESINALRAVMSVFVSAYNQFGAYKQKHRVPVIHKSQYPNKHLHKYRDLPKSIIDFL
jgi:hypothetical protein